MTLKYIIKTIYLPLILSYLSLSLIPVHWVFAESQSTPIEARAIWISRWSYHSPDDIKTIMHNLKAINANIAIFQVRGQAETYYKSAYEPWSEAISPDGTDPGWDPLSVAVEEAHQQGLQLHAWINVYPAWRGTTPPKSPNQLWNAHPDWFCYNRDGRRMPLSEEYVVLNPAHPAVQEHLYNVFMELVKNYDIDGLHFDYVRYYDSSYSYDSISLQRFYEQYHGTPDTLPEQWNAFRREQVTGLIRRTYQDMKSIKPNAMLSAAVWGNYADGYTGYLQDSHRWLAEGIVDFICPMMYTLDDGLYTNWAKRHLRNQHQRLVYPGIGAYLMENPEQEVLQIEINRAISALDKIKGTTIFDYSVLFDGSNRTKLGDALVTGPFAQPAIAPDPTMLWWKTSSQPDVVGPIITDLQTDPKIVRMGEPFKVSCNIHDPSGIQDNSVTLQCNFIATSGEEKAINIKMLQDSNTSDTFITAENIPEQFDQTGFELRVQAYDTAGNLGESEHTQFSFYYPPGKYQQIGEFGNTYNIGQFAVCDQQGKVWMTELRPPQVRIFNPDATEAAISKISTGLNAVGEKVAIYSPAGIAIDRHNIVYIACDTAGKIFKFRAKDGKPLPGFAVPYTPGDLAIDAAGYIYVIDKLHERWHIYSPQGKEVNGSPFGNVSSQAMHINRGIAVTKDRKTVYIADEAAGAIHKWVGGIKSGVANFEQKPDLCLVQDASGAVDIDLQGNIYVSNYGANCIQIYDKTEKHIADLVGGNPTIRHPRGVAFTKAGKTIYLVIMDYGIQGGKLQKWIIK
ncbi:MAG: family 10 glycosylhydrolase [bacterium]